MADQEQHDREVAERCVAITRQLRRYAETLSKREPRSPRPTIMMKIGQAAMLAGASMVANAIGITDADEALRPIRKALEQYQTLALRAMSDRRARF